MNYLQLTGTHLVCGECLQQLTMVPSLETSTHFGQRSATGSQDACERRLLAAVAGGDQGAISELYTIYYPRLFRFLYGLSRDFGLTEEVINDVMLIVWRSAEKFRGSSKVSTWVLGIGYRQCVKKLRKRRLPQTDEREVSEPKFDSSAAVELDDVIAKALAELSAEHRMMIESVLYLGMTYAEVAEVVGCPVNTAKSRVHNARKKLRATLTSMGYVAGVKND